jgi:hypothetical protein
MLKKKKREENKIDKGKAYSCLGLDKKTMPIPTLKKLKRKIWAVYNGAHVSELKKLVWTGLVWASPG